MVTVHHHQLKEIDKHTGEGKYYCEGECRSSDVKPTNWFNGSKLLEIDTGKIWCFDEESGVWEEL